MKSLIYKGNETIELDEVQKPRIEAGTDVIVRVLLTTICGSDLHVLHNETVNLKPPFPVGHECVGVVEEVGADVRGFKPGDRAAVPAAVYCCECDNCRRGLCGHCENGGVFGHGESYGGLGGCMSEYVRVPRADTCLVKVPDGVTDEQALLVGDIMVTAYSAVADAGIEHGDTVVVYGVGPVGLCAVLAARLYSPSRIIAVGRRDRFRVDMARSIGADIVMLSSEEDVVARVRELTGGRGADDAIECAGSSESLVNALRCVRIGGTVSVCGVFGKPVELPMPDVCQNNLTMKMGLGNMSLMPRVMRLVEAGKLDPSVLITQRMKLDDVVEAFDIFEHRTQPCIKIALEL